MGEGVAGALKQLRTYRSHVNDFAGLWVDDNLAGGTSLEDRLRQNAGLGFYCDGENKP
jgi:hypothetical protein